MPAPPASAVAAMMDRPLAPALRAASCGRDLVFLNLADGAYDLMAGAADLAQVSPSGRRLELADTDLEAELRSEGRIVDRADLSDDRPLPDLPRRSALTEPPPAWSGSEWSRLVAAWADLGFTYRGRPFLASIQRPGRTVEAPTASPGAILRRARGVHQHLPWIPMQGDCMFRCALLLRALTPTERANVRWVFGVKTWPFYAHCWLQYDDVALTDHHEPLAGFSPIYAV